MPSGDWLTIGSGHVIVVADAIVELEIRLDRPWSEVVDPAASG